jgi:voltage-gated potassium channel
MLLLRLVRLARRVRNRRSIGFLAIAAMLSVAVLGNAACFYLFERPVKPEIDWGDAFWYSAVSITTIGYGDFAASTLGARLGTVGFVMLLGLTSFSLFIGMAIDGIAMAVTRAQKGLGWAMAKDHILIVHFPSEQRVLQLIDEIRSDPEQGDCEIVIIADTIDELPFKLPDVLFVRGSSHDIETYTRARASECRMAVVLSPDYGNRNSDAIVAAAVSVIDRIKSEIYIVAECLEEKHRSLFDSCHCDAIVLSMQIAGSLLIQEVHDPGIAQVVEVMSSNRRGTTLFAVEVTDDGVAYLDVARNLLGRSVTVLGINRGTETRTLFEGYTSKVGDRIVYSAVHRIEWPALRALAGV